MIPQEVRDSEMAWGGNAELLPKRVPRAFQKPEANKATSKAVFRNAAIDLLAMRATSPTYEPKDGIDGKRAFRHILAALRCKEVEEEVRISSVAYLIDQWFSKFEYSDRIR